MIGVAINEKNLNESMGFKGAWGICSNGDVFLDSSASEPYLHFSFSSGSLVLVTVNIYEGWIQFTVDGTEGK